MAQEAHEAPVVGRGSSSTSPATGIMWERQTQTHAPPFSSWSPYAGTIAGGAGGPAFGAHLLTVAAVDSSLPSEHAPDHAWKQSAPITGVHGGSGYRGNFLSLLEAKNVTPEMFEDVVPAACDYLGGVGTAAAVDMAGRGLRTVDRPSVAGSVPPDKHETASTPLVYSGSSGDSAAPAAQESGMVRCMPCYDHEVKVKLADGQQQGFGAAAFLQQMMIAPTRVELQGALGYSGMGSESRLLEPSFGVGCLQDGGSFSDYRSTEEFFSSNSNRQEQGIRPAGMGSSCSGNGAAAASVATTRRKSEDRVGGNTKRSKRGPSNKASPPKPQEPKVKLGEKITALQQIVSPFGKTDTSSVLFETISYIKYLHDQIRLFSEPYMAKGTYKGHIPFGGEEKEGNGTGHDLRGRGLCLVPVSLTSQAYHDDTTLPDCWSPAYRNCLYR